MPPLDDLTTWSPAELTGMVVQPWERIVASNRSQLRVMGLRGARDEEIPGSARSKVTIDEEQTVAVAVPPRGSCFKG